MCKGVNLTTDLRYVTITAATLKLSPCSPEIVVGPALSVTLLGGISQRGAKEGAVKCTSDVRLPWSLRRLSYQRAGPTELLVVACNAVLTPSPSLLQQKDRTIV